MLRGFLTSRREIARRETATFLPIIQQKSSKKAAKSAILAQMAIIVAVCASSDTVVAVIFLTISLSTRRGRSLTFRLRGMSGSARKKRIPRLVAGARQGTISP